MAPPATADLNQRAAAARSSLNAALQETTSHTVKAAAMNPNTRIPQNNTDIQIPIPDPVQNKIPHPPAQQTKKHARPSEPSPYSPSSHLHQQIRTSYHNDHGSPYALASLREAVGHIEQEAARTATPTAATKSSVHHAPLDSVAAAENGVAAAQDGRVGGASENIISQSMHAAPSHQDNSHSAVLGSNPLPPKPLAVKRFRIALMAWESLHSIAVGGVAPHLTELAAGLERRGHEVHVFVRTGAGQEPYQLIDGVHIHRVAFELNPDFIQEITNMCNSMVHFMLETEVFMNAHFDLIHCHDWLAAPALINIKHNHNRRCVFTVHSTEYGRCGNKVYGGQSARIRNIEQDAIACADRVIAVSGVLCDEVKAHYSFDWEKLRCVYNGINCLRYDGALWDPAEVRAKYGVGPLDPMVLTVGRLVVQKGVDILVEAVPSVLAARPDAKFVIVGDGYMKDSIVARVHQLGIQGSVCFTGSMGGQNLVDLFKATDLVAIPSRNEPFGIVVLEAWAASKPVVATKSGGPREFVWHDNDGFVVDTTAEGLAWGICAGFANFTHMKYMGERGRVKAAFQFSWDNISGNTNNIYDELLVDHPGLPDEDPVKGGTAIQDDKFEPECARKEPVTTTV